MLLINVVWEISKNRPQIVKYFNLKSSEVVMWPWRPKIKNFFCCAAQSVTGIWPCGPRRNSAPSIVEMYMHVMIDLRRGSPVLLIFPISDLN